MSDDFIAFDDIRARIDTALDAARMPADSPPLYLVRDLRGRLRIAVKESEEEIEGLQRLADILAEKLGRRGYSPDQGVLKVSPELLKTLENTRQKVRPGIYLADRLVTGSDWWTADNCSAKPGRRAARFTFFSVKGGVGRSTTAVVLAWHLACRGERVLVVDLDLESPGLSSAMLARDRLPKFGITDWFVEDLVEQADAVAADMLAAPAWAQNLDGDVRVAPAHGHDPGEYLAKLGRVYMSRGDESWAARLERMLESLEEKFQPTVVMLESRSGLHDIAAATVTDLGATVLLFAVDSDSTWADYDILFRHWRDHGLANRIREQLSVVSALTPDLGTRAYLDRFRERTWNLFRDHLYDEVDASSEADDHFTYDMDDQAAPHYPMVIHWTRGFGAGARLRNPEETPVAQAYTEFFDTFGTLIEVGYGIKE